MQVSAWLLLLNISLHLAYALIKACLENQYSCWVISSEFLRIFLWTSWWVIFSLILFPFIPIYLTFSIFSSVFITSQSMKPNSTWKGACWLVVGGSWLVALSLWKHMGWWENLHNSYGFITPISMAFERQVTKKVDICPIVTLSTQFSHAKVRASFYLSYLWICIMYILYISKIFTLPITCHAVFHSL